MATKWQEKNVGVVLKFKPGTTKETPVKNEIDGSVGGKQVEHHDGSVDAVIVPATVGAKSQTQEGM